VIVETSALISILREEPDAQKFLDAIGSAELKRISAANYLEAAIVIDAERNPISSRRLDEFLSRAEIEILPLTEVQARIARQAYRDFGKGSGHPAKLNFGDCFAYALAIDTGEGLLFQGSEFTHTGVKIS